MGRQTAAVVVLAMVLTMNVEASERERAKPAGAKSKVKSVAVGSNEFGLALYERLRAEKQGNLFFSPYSISTALAMTYVGARGQTRKQMADVLRFKLEGEQLDEAFAKMIGHMRSKDSKAGFQLCVANRLWAQHDYRFLKSFLDTTGRSYDAQATYVDFKKDVESARKTINRWVEKKTHDKIRDLLKKDTVDNATRLVLVNAIYFKGDWTTPFKKRWTKDAPFFVTPEKKVKVKMMNQTDYFRYGDAHGLQVLAMTYGRRRAQSMVILLPRLGACRKTHPSPILS